MLRRQAERQRVLKLRLAADLLSPLTRDAAGSSRAKSQRQLQGRKRKVRFRADSVVVELRSGALGLEGAELAFAASIQPLQTALVQQFSLVSTKILHVSQRQDPGARTRYRLVAVDGSLGHH